jgi:hypothetical protein
MTRANNLLYQLETRGYLSAFHGSSARQLLRRLR